MMKQIELNPTWQQKKLREFCEKKGIVVTAYSPLGSGSFWGSNGVMGNELLNQIGEAHGKSVAQVTTFTSNSFLNLSDVKFQWRNIQVYSSYFDVLEKSIRKSLY